MTEQEEKVLNLLADAWNEFLKLEPSHDWHREEFMKAIHQAQWIVFSREGLRSLE